MEKTKIIDIPDGCKQIQVTESLTDTIIKFLPERMDYTSQEIEQIKKFGKLLDSIEKLKDKYNSCQDKKNYDELIDQIKDFNIEHKVEKSIECRIISQTSGMYNIQFNPGRDLFLTNQEYIALHDKIIYNYKNKVQ